MDTRLCKQIRQRIQLMSFSFWQARIVEVREEIDRVLSQSANSIHKADSIIRLLQDKYLGLQIESTMGEMEVALC